MNVQHGAWVLVMDGSKALVLVNEGDGEFLDLRLVRKWEQDLPFDRELKSATPGRTFSSQGHGNRRSAYQETNFHDQAEAELAAKIAEFLNDQMQGRGTEQLVIVAPPRTLGELRRHLRSEVSDRVTAEIANDLVKHPVQAIEQLLSAHAEPANVSER